MDITPLVPEGTLLLTGYGAGGFKINGEQQLGSVILTGGKNLKWDVSEFSHIDVEVLVKQLDPSTEILLLGTGEKHHLSPALVQACRERKIALDIMTTGAACRTYNVLQAEGRKISAALIAV